MTARILDGKAFAARLNDETARELAALGAGAPPGLAVVLVGDDPASHVYVRAKDRAARELGLRAETHRLPAATTQVELLDLVRRLNDDPLVDGILVQLPLPPAIDSRRVIDAIDPAKDVDGFHVVNVGRLQLGLPSLVPCTPLGCALLLDAEGGSLKGAHAVVIGRSNIVGKPMAQLLLQRDCTVTTAHSRSRDLPAIARQADILIAAVGRAEMVRGSWIKPGAIVIDVGINRVPVEGGTRLVGDVAFAEAAAVAGAITPVPGGVGPLTIACLMRNTVSAARARR